MGLEAWTLLVSSAKGLLLVQHALRLGPQRQEATVRALLVHEGVVETREARAERATVDPGRERALWDGHSLSAEESYGQAGEWRWRLRAQGVCGALAVPTLAAALSDVWLSAPQTRLELKGEVDLGTGWTAVTGSACLLHRASSEGAGPWAWLALPGRGLVAAQWRLPGLPLSLATGREGELWPLAWRARLRPSKAGWWLERPGKPALELLERGRLRLERSMTATVALVWVEEAKTGERGVLETLEPRW